MVQVYATIKNILVAITLADLYLIAFGLLEFLWNFVQSTKAYGLYSWMCFLGYKFIAKFHQAIISHEIEAHFMASCCPESQLRSAHSLVFQTLLQE